MDRSEPRALPDLNVLESVAARIGVELDCRLIVLFGSLARRAAAPRDLDIGLLAGHPLDLVAVTNRLIRELGTQAVDAVDLLRADPLLLAVVAQDGIPLYERAAGEFSRFASLAVRRYADTRKFREAERQEILERVARLEALV